MPAPDLLVLARQVIGRDHVLLLADLLEGALASRSAWRARASRTKGSAEASAEGRHTPTRSRGGAVLMSKRGSPVGEARAVRPSSDGKGGFDFSLQSTRQSKATRRRGVRRQRCRFQEERHLDQLGRYIGHAGHTDRARRGPRLVSAGSRLRAAGNTSTIPNRRALACAVPVRRTPS